ncbi:hypothetical protein HX109_10920 [Galbibacter sp. BG1]|uniref:hypothetical protein n=1 Tax=Galbibacter sp. BG1 TaxID=1170699 RepID=UPI0015BB7873|nr:hypothetical protein [Galbibacter sp. BG1]QLE02040.1 hypothetical protein HX109_10920 [Galbibacter sp. BG1]
MMKMDNGSIYKTVFNFLLLVIVYSCADIVEEPDISGERVKVIAPANQTEVKGNVVNFTWEPLPDATSYLLQVASPDFNQAAQVFVDSLLPETSFSRELLPNDYQWRVKAVNSAYETAYTTTSFSVRESEGFTGNTVLLNSPTNDFLTNDAEVNFSWEAVQEAVEYQIQVIDQADVVIIDETIDSIGAELTLTEGNSRWQVRAINSNNENTLYSSRTISVDLTNPSTPEPTSPLDEGVASAGEVTYTWERENIPGSAERDSIFIFNDEGETDLYRRGLGEDKSFTTDMEIGEFYWRVKAYDAAGNFSDDSALFSLTVN